MTLDSYVIPVIRLCLILIAKSVITTGTVSFAAFIRLPTVAT